MRRRTNARPFDPVYRVHQWSAAVAVGGFATLVSTQLLLGRWYRPDGPVWFNTVWVAAGLAAVVLMAGNMGLTAVAVYRRAARGRRADRRTNELRGLSERCRKCEFDLRAATAVRCPECGTYHGSQPARRFRGWRR